ncbi:MAG TPA: riboflavin synthase [Magnetospirillaceae bacterium]|jgi:riboflavin synthase
MFTGIITDIGEVTAVIGTDERRLAIATTYDPDTIPIGASIACSGICLTVTELRKNQFSVVASAETIAKTTLGAWKKGTKLNLERALKVGNELGGHIVSGHTDGVAKLVSTRKENDSIRLVFAPPAELAKFVAPKGSVALEGVSLTVNEVDDSTFGVNIIPHTAAHTTLGALKPGDAVNMEIDMLARYVARLIAKA